MGVHGLWELLAPVGRRVSVETLAGKTLAVDASIWMVQFVKAMRDERGEMVRNAHLLGFFRRICKLLFLRTRPVFVFDGGTPALKRRTVIARRRQRENAQAKVRKTAEKLLLNHLKASRLKELADDIKNQRLKQESGKKLQEKSNLMDAVGSDVGRSHVNEPKEMAATISLVKEDRNLSARCNQEELDEMLAASIAAEENGILARKGVASTVMISSEEECDTNEETVLPSNDAEVDLAVLAALPHSMQLDILAQLKGKKTGPTNEVGNEIRPEVSDSGKGKGIIFDETDMVGCSSRCNDVISRSDNQNKFDEMLAASIDMEDNAKLLNNVSSILEGSKEEDGDYDEEMILPATHSEVDATVLASLPPSMQLELLVQMRERLIAENRQKYQKVKKDPGKFSELQIQAYLKTVAFRREIDGVQKAAVGGVGGVQTSRIASEANREYIFSSSFTGDKQELTSTRLEKSIGDTQQMAQRTHPSQNFVNNIAIGNGSYISGGLVCDEPREPVDESIQTYVDESGRFRVSRLRAMGMRMTRDIQRNLDLMKENDQERTSVCNATKIETKLNTKNNGSSDSSVILLNDNSWELNTDLVGENVQNEQLMLGKDTSIEISFECDHKNEFISGEDDIFANLVGGNSVALFHADETAVKVRSSVSDSDCDWEEGNVEGMNTNFPVYNKLESKFSVADEQHIDVSEEELVEGDCNGTKNTTPCPAETEKLESKGRLEEESNLQDAIRKSLKSTLDVKHKCASFVHDTAVKVRSSGSYSDSDWEEGIDEGKSTIFPVHNKVESKFSVADEHNIKESEELVEGDCNGYKSTLSHPAESGKLASKSGKLASKGRLEEESDLQDAIRRSLEITPDGKHKCASPVPDQLISHKYILDPDLEHLDNPCCSGPMNLNDNSMGGFNLSEGGTEQSELHEIVDGDKKQNYVTRNNPHIFHIHGSQSKSFMTLKSNNADILIDEPNKLDGHSRSKDSIPDANMMMKDEIPTPMVAGQLLDKHDDSKVSFCGNNLDKADPLCLTEEEKKKCINESEPLSSFTDNMKPAIYAMEPSFKRPKEDLDMELKSSTLNNDENLPVKSNSNVSKDSVNTIGDFPAQLTEDQLEEEIQILDQEYMNLESEQRKLERNAESVNSELFTECQELLQMFGLPYIIAPMEAEAQCAYLQLAKLVDGVVTDDSDVLLFGGRSVYKNIFDDRKYVETYFLEDIEKELGLTREKLIHMALLLGSDYTEGVSGIGIVNAIEVLNAFPEEDGLLQFRQWVESPDPSILGGLNAKTGSNTRKKGLKVEERINFSNCNIGESTSDQNISHAQEQRDSLDHIQEIKQTFMDKHRNVSKNWHIPSSFPSETVISAYLSPHVDKSTEPLMWGKPDHLVLRKLCWEKFGWTSKKADELLLPVLKEYNKHETQLRLEAFYSFNERFAKVRSNRIKKAVKGIVGKQPSDLVDGSAENLSKGRKNGRGSPDEPGDDKFGTSMGTEESLGGRKQSKKKESAKRKNDGVIVAKAHTKKKKIGDDLSSAPVTSEEEQHRCKSGSEHKALVRNESGRGRGRGRGRGVKRNREEETETETSCSGSDIDNHGTSAQAGVSKVPITRRSMRSRKPVNYSLKDLEVEDAVNSFDQSNRTCLHDDGFVEEKSSDINDAHGDDAIDFSRVKESSIIESPQKDNLPESEGWFSMDACATSGTSNLDNSVDLDPSDDYLKMGGGFCLEDNEIEEKDAVDGRNTAKVDSTVENLPGSEVLGGTDCDRSSSDLFSGAETVKSQMQGGGTSHEFGIEPNDQSDIRENARQISGSSAVAFSAMPFLRKKRKN